MFENSEIENGEGAIVTNVRHKNQIILAIDNVNKAIETPISSIISLVFLIPAVSIIFIGIPLIEIYSSIVSLVVPSISLTIALSSFNSKFKSEDLPV